MKVVTTEQMREIDRITIEERGIPGEQLMEKAGLAVVERVLKVYQPRSVAIVTGKGNNAGDGLVVARHLCQNGIKTKVFMLADPKELEGDARSNFTKLPIEVEKEIINNARQLKSQLSQYDCAIDAILGTGVKGEVKGLFAETITAINESDLPVVAVDIPSGLIADTEWFEGECIRANLTVTMGLPKLGMVIHPGLEYCGQIEVARLDFPDDLLTNPELKINLLTEAMIRERLPQRPLNSNKKTFGYLMIIAGSTGLTGAAILAGKAASASGVGLTYVAIPEALNPILETQLIDQVTIPIPSKTGTHLDSTSRDEIMKHLERMDAVALGPGIGTARGTQKLVKDLIRAINKPMVIDADGINAVVGATVLLEDRQVPTIITPHPGEMARLFDTTPSMIQQARITTACQFAVQHDVILVLKGARTAIATPDGEIYINPTGNTALAKGGSGDVLAGMMGSFLAQGLSPLDAAICAVYMHGRAGELAAEELTEFCVTPPDLIDFLPLTFQELL